MTNQLSLVPWMSGDHPYLTLELEMWVDGLQLPENCGVIDLRRLVASAETSGRYFVFTCTCGEASCAGYFEGVEVEHRNGTVAWHDRDTDRTFSFDAAAYRTEIANAMRLMNDMLGSVTHERVAMEWKKLFPEWVARTEAIAVSRPGAYRRVKGSTLPDEEVLTWRLFAVEVIHGIAGMPAALWYMLKEQRKAEWEWLRARLRRGQRD